ncbi:hypothetical protein DL89DRAFT_259866 [Linderina pennispora]|uniref:Uncharacterized protein n=1 Tax=Linderina pennispora TaxID=61395 RepID=A0A1Y1W0C2_9FUNG|nr:uncharacterized protein DL89DRAFT_259866 [Linderina pennispora]ORX66735.1 hypothetical protein DL89DRAFT_259866 [Linderina pennispora]
MNIFLSAAKLVQLAVLAFAGWLLLQSLFLSVQTFMVFYFPTTNVPYLHPVPPANETAEPISLAWKEPFEYEAKVYVNNKSCDSDSLETFFQNATEVWHIEPQSLANRYPVFEKRLSLNLTDTGHKSMCVFIQKAGQFTPHPNISDPHLLVGERWLTSTIGETTCYSDDQKGKGIKAHCVSKSTFQVDTQAKWKIHLEDNVYRSDSLPNIHCNKCTIAHGQAVKSDSTTDSMTDSTSAKDMEWKRFPLADGNSTSEEPEALSATVDIDMRIRGVRTSIEQASKRIERRVDDRVHKLLKLNEGKGLALGLNLGSSTARSTVSTAIYLALYPALLSLWLIQQLYIARLYLASACSNGGKASSIFGMYLFQEFFHVPLVSGIGLAVPHAGLYWVLITVCAVWRFIKLLVVIMPQRWVAGVIRFFSGSRATNPSDKEKGDNPLQNKQGSEDDDLESAYSEICSQTFKLLLMAIAASLVVEYAYQAYISGGVEIQDLLKADGSQISALLSGHGPLLLPHGVLGLCRLLHSIYYFGVQTQVDYVRADCVPSPSSDRVYSHRIALPLRSSPGGRIQLCGGI